MRACVKGIDGTGVDSNAKGASIKTGYIRAFSFNYYLLLLHFVQTKSGSMKSVQRKQHMEANDVKLPTKCMDCATFANMFTLS